MNPGELDLIQRFPGWEFFGTLTFKGKTPSVRKGRGFAVSHFMRVASALKVPFPCLVWCLREELGELGGRLHYHYLIGRTGLPLTEAGVQVLKRVWERVGKGRGFSVVKVYDHALKASDYLCKETVPAVSAASASYEVRKFDRSEEPPVLSASLLRWLERAAAAGRKGRECSGPPSLVIRRPDLRGTTRREAMRAGRLGVQTREVSDLVDKTGMVAATEPGQGPF